MHWGKSLSQRERVARASGPGEGYRNFKDVSFFCTPHPPPHILMLHPLPLGEGFIPDSLQTRTANVL